VATDNSGQNRDISGIWTFSGDAFTFTHSGGGALRSGALVMDSTNRMLFPSSFVLRSNIGGSGNGAMVYETPIVDGDLSDWSDATFVSIRHVGPLADWWQVRPSMTVGEG
jgi:hypothetical protein